MLEKLFESLDEKVFTNEMKETMQTSFNEAVEVKAIELADVKISEKTDELSEEADKFNEKQGVFVTLHKDTHLRGCIGFPSPTYPLNTAIIEASDL